MRGTFRIVVWVDGSRQARRALEWALEEATVHGRAGRPAVVQAVVTWQAEDPAAQGWDLVNTSQPEKVAEAVLAAEVSRVSAEHPDATVAGVVIEGPVADVLGRVADDADLLVLGDHGSDRLHDTSLGSVTEDCIRGAICPVVVIPTSRSSSTTFAHEALATTAG